MTDTVEEIIEAEGWMAPDEIDDARRGATFLVYEDHHHTDCELRRQVKVTIEVLADEPVPQRGDVWEDEAGYGMLLDRRGGDNGMWHGVIVGRPVWDKDRPDGVWTVWSKPVRLVARLDADGGDGQ